MFSLFVFLIVLSALVLIHELGHYLAARLFGVKADEFGLGFPPRATGLVRVGKKWKRVKGSYEKTYDNTIWSLNWLPLGGFVKLKGENGEGVFEADSFQSKSPFAKFVILAAGVTMNWLLAATIFSVGFMVGIPADVTGAPSQAIISGTSIEITEVISQSAAAKAGIEPGDTLVAVNGTEIDTIKRAQDLIASNGSKSFPLTIKHKQEQKTITVTPEMVAELHRPGLGIAMSQIGTIRFPWHLAIVQGVVTTYDMTRAILSGMSELISNLVHGNNVSNQVSGPVGIAVITGKVAHQGIWQLLQFAAMLSINLAIVNFLPIPALDGGRAIIVIVEAIRRKRINQNFELNLHRIGFIFLILVVLLVTVHDVWGLLK